MNVLALTDAVTGGGLESYVAASTRGLREAGASVTVATRSDVGWSGEHETPSSDAAARLAELARRTRADVIAIHNVLDAALITAAKQHAPRVIYHLHDHRLFCPNGDRVYPRGRKRCKLPMGAACVAHALAHGCAYGPRTATASLLRRRSACARAVMGTDAIVVFSDFMQRTAEINGVERSQLRRLAPPIDDAFFTPSETIPSRSVLFCGRAQTVKGLQSLVRALALIPKERRPFLTVAGEGPDIEPAADLAKKSGCRYALLGRIERDEVIDAIDRCSILAMPSLWDEPFGLSGIEAFARGRPVVAFATGAVLEWIGRGGCAVPWNDTAAFARAIEHLLDAAHWSEASNAARVSAQSYRMQQHIPALMRLYAQ